MEIRDERNDADRTNGSETVEKFNAAGEPTKVTRAKGQGEETSTEYEYKLQRTRA